MHVGSTSWLALLLVMAAHGREVPQKARFDKGQGQQLSLKPAIERGLVNLCLGIQRAANVKGENVIFAPFSIAAVHALLLAASTGNTKKELETLFGVEKIPYRQEDLHRLLSQFIFNVEMNNQVENNLMSASGLFPQVDNQISPAYVEFAKKVYQSDVIPVDFKRKSFEATEFINRWVSNRTEEKIKLVLDEVADPTTSIIIANALYFKGSWEQPFTVKYTKMQNFFVSKTETVKVPMMVSILNVLYSYQKGKQAFLGLPYKGGDLVMYFVLPDTDLNSFIGNLTLDSVRELINQTSRKEVIVAIPRMRVEGTLELSKALYSLGLHSMFDKRTTELAAFGPGSYVSEVIHKVAVEVTEWGTEAAATTSTIIHRDGSMPVFRADRPFLFFIYHHKNNAILFWGSVSRPI